MKRIALLILLVTLFSLVLESCGPSPSTTQAPLVEPSATASPTKSVGNADQTSSTPEEESIQYPSLQEDNLYEGTTLEVKLSNQLVDNRIGSVAETKNYPPFLLNDSGTKWSRVIIDPWGNWQQVDWDADEYTIDPSDEKVIDDLVSNDIKVMLVLDIWHPNSRTVFLKTDEDIAIYTNWVRFMVRHFKGCITYYEILNEPDLSFSSPSGMPVDAYVNLVNHTVPVIREEDPNAKIVLGAVPDTRWPDARWWLWDLLNSGVMPLVDGVS